MGSRLTYNPTTPHSNIVILDVLAKRTVLSLACKAIKKQ